MKIRQFKLSAISLISGLAFDSAATFAGQVHEIDAAKAIGATKCGEWQKYGVEAWKLTRHFKTFDTNIGAVRHRITVENCINDRQLGAAFRWAGRQLVSFEDG